VHVLTVASTRLVACRRADCHHDQQNLAMGSTDLAQVQACTVLQQIVKFARDHENPESRARGTRFDQATSLLPGIARGMNPVHLSAQRRRDLSEAGARHTTSEIRNQPAHVQSCHNALGWLERS
jgi:hypothetical protein